MFRISWFYILTVFIICTVVYSQDDYYDYDHDNYDNYDDYPIESYPTRQGHNRYGRMGEARYFSDSQEGVNTRGIVSKLTGIVSSGKCIIKCVYGNLKNCDGLISCIWKCFSTNTEPNPNQDDRDITVGNVEDSPNPKSNSITPNELVKLVICMVRCLVRYLPRSSTTLQRFGTCFAVRCVCADPQASQ